MYTHTHTHTRIHTYTHAYTPGFPSGSVSKNLPANEEDIGNEGSIPVSGRSPEEGEGEGGMFRENSIETCILSRVKQITSPGWMHETSAWG